MAYRTSYGKSEWFNPRENCHKRLYPNESSRQAAEYALQMYARKHGDLPSHDLTRLEKERLWDVDGRPERARFIVFFKGDDPDKSRYSRRGRQEKYEEVARFEIPNWDWVPTVREFVETETGPLWVAA